MVPRANTQVFGRQKASLVPIRSLAALLLMVLPFPSYTFAAAIPHSGGKQGAHTHQRDQNHAGIGTLPCAPFFVSITVFPRSRSFASSLPSLSLHPARSKSTSMDYSKDYKRVLNYLNDMIEVCRRAHRPDLAGEYEDAWELAAGAIYGPLPARPKNRVFYAAAPKPAGPPPRWRTEMLAKPYRRISRRVDNYEVLECGHLVLAIADLPGAPPAKRRRCGQCAQTSAKKPIASIRPARGKAVTA